MAEDKTCNKCGKRGLSWDRDFHKKTKKWKLENHRRADGKWWNKPPQKLFSKSKVILCSLCKDSNFGLCRSEDDYERHLKGYHSSGETLTNLDYMYQHSNLKGVNLFYWRSDPHYEKYKKLQETEG